MVQALGMLGPEAESRCVQGYHRIVDVQDRDECVAADKWTHKTAGYLCLCFISKCSAKRVIRSYIHVPQNHG